MGLGESECIVSGGVSVRHTDNRKYECKIVKVEEAKLLLHWHGFGRSKDFWIERDSADLGLLDLADVAPPAPTKSLKKVAKATPAISGGQQNLASATVEGKENGSDCKGCSAPLQEHHLQCDECHLSWHLSCSGLPDYMLVRFVASEIGFMCEPCVKAKWAPEKLAGFEAKVREGKLQEKNAVDSSSQVPSVSDRTKTSGDVPKKGICQRYRRGSCPHGSSGKKAALGKDRCPYEHPRLCFGWRKGGADKQLGCKWGNKCKFFHPILCKAVGDDGKCPNSNCTLLHVRRKPRAIREVNLQQPVVAVEPESRDQANSFSADVGAQSGTFSGAVRTPPRNEDNIAISSKNDGLERIEKMILSMQAKHEQDLRTLRQELVQSRSFTMPWMSPHCQCVNRPHGGLHPVPSLQSYVPMSCSSSMQHSSS